MFSLNLASNANFTFCIYWPSCVALVKMRRRSSEYEVELGSACTTSHSSLPQPPCVAPPDRPTAPSEVSLVRFRRTRGTLPLSGHVALARAGSELHSGERGLRGRGSRARLQGRRDNERGEGDNQHLFCQHVVILYNTLALTRTPRARARTLTL